MKLDAYVHKPVLQAHRHACHTVGSLLHTHVIAFGPTEVPGTNGFCSCMFLMTACRGT